MRFPFSSHISQIQSKRPISIQTFLTLTNFNMKQKIVIRMHLDCRKCRSKAMQVASVADGVTSVAIEGEDKDQVVVIGDGVDATKLTSSLRKKVGYASLESVAEVKAPVDHKSEPSKIIQCEPSYYHYPVCNPNPCYQYPVYDPSTPCCQYSVYDPNPPNCSIM